MQAVTPSMLNLTVVASSSGIVIADATRPGIPIVYANQAFERLTGRSASAVIGQNFSTLIDDDQGQAAAAYDEGLEWTVTARNALPQGDAGWIETRVSPMRDDGGRLTQWVAVQRDVTDRINAELEAKQRTAEINLLYDAARQIGATLDPLQVYQNTYRVIASVMDCDQFTFSTFDSTARMIRWRYAIINGQAIDVSSMPLLPLSEDPTRGPQSIAVHSARSMYLADYPAYVRHSLNPNYFTFDGRVESVESAIAQDLIPRSGLVVPLTFEGQVAGVLQVLSFRADAYSEQNLRFVETLAVHLAGANNNALLYASVQAELAERKRVEAAEQEQRALAEALRDTASILSSSLDLPTIMHRLLEYAGRVKAHDAANIMILHESVARITYTRGYSPASDAFIRGRAYPLELAPLDYMAHTGQPMVIPDAEQYPGWIPLPEPPFVGSALMTPLLIRNQVIGFLSLDSYTRGFFTEADLGRMQAIADQAAVALENAQLYEQIQAHASQLEERVVERTVALKRTAEHMVAIIESSSDGIVLVDLDGRLRSINAAFEQLVGCHADEIRGLPLWEVIARDNPEPLLNSLRLIAVSHERERIELVCTRIDGGNFYADVAFTWLPDSDPNAATILCGFHDITVRKQAETELRQRLEKERQLNELKARFTSMVSHEFRTPLAVIQTSSDILKRYDQRIGPEKRQEYLDRIQQQVRQLAALQEEVLQLSRAENVGLALRREPIRLVDFSRKLIEEFQEIAPHHRLAFISAGPGIEIALDARLIHDAISNLISNGIKYSPEGSVVTLEIDAEHDPVLISVRDQGIGIPPGDQPHVFDAFQRATNVGAIQGTGLGLAIVKRAVEAHSGTIEVHSEERRGTTFTIRLPLSGSANGD